MHRKPLHGKIKQHIDNIDTKNTNLKAKTRWKDGVIHPTLSLKTLYVKKTMKTKRKPQKTVFFTQGKGLGVNLYLILFLGKQLTQRNECQEKPTSTKKSSPKKLDLNM